MSEIEIDPADEHGEREETTVVDPQTEEGEEPGPETGEEVDEDAQEDHEEEREPEPETEKEPVEEVEIVLEGEEPAAAALKDSTAWARLRKQEADLRKRNQELEMQLAAKGQPPQAADPGPKPKLEDFDYDAEVFEEKLDAWKDSKAQHETAKSRAVEQAQAGALAWQKTLGVFASARDELTRQMPSYVEAETQVQSSLDAHQQGVLIHVAKKNAPMVIAALGKRPELLKDLAAEKDSALFVAKVAKLEARLKMAKKTQAPPPERPIKGSGTSSGSTDSQLERLRAKAAETGDYTKINEYKQSQKVKDKKKK